MSDENDPRPPYFSAAMDILAAEGYGGLKLAPLCRRLGVTTGAFYHHFNGWKDFTTRLLDHWHAERTTRVIEPVLAYPDARDRLEALISAATTGLPHRAEAAIRVWSRLDPEVEKLQASVDADRYGVVFEAFRELVGEGDAARFAQAGLYLLIGFEQSGTADDTRVLEWSLRLLLTTALSQADAPDDGADIRSAGQSAGQV